MELPPQVGKFEIVDLIGRGGMGVIYKARDNVLERFVAVKVMSSDLLADAGARTRFLREARAASMLQHANIVVVYEFGEHDDSPYIAMEFLDGESLDHVIRRIVPPSMLEKTDIILQVLKALQYAHSKGVIHRDIKPGNIMCVRDGTVKVVDFGIAHLAHQTMTRTGMILGTLAYLAPEQLNGESVDGRTDVYSLGVVLYQLLTGKLPFEGTNTAETVNKILLCPPPPLPEDCAANTPDLQTITDKALAKKKEKRFRTCAEMAEALALVRKRLEEQEQTQLAIFGEEKPLSLTQVGTRDVAKLSFPPPQPVDSAEVSILGMVQPLGNWRKWALAIFVVVAGAAIFYPWLTRSRTPPSSSLRTNAISLSATRIPDKGRVSLTPTAAHVVGGGRLDFSATVGGTNDTELIWSVREGDLGGSIVARAGGPGGSDASFRAVYFAPNTPGKYHVVVTTKAEPHMSAIAEVMVTTGFGAPSMMAPKKQPQSDSPFEVR